LLLAEYCGVKILSRKGSFTDQREAAFALPPELGAAAQSIGISWNRL
jgi:hypothetical protein